MVKFGLFIAKQYPQDEPAYQRFQEHLEQVRLARDLGFDTIVLGQHFLSEPFQEPQSIPLLARLSADSGDMRLALSIVLAALMNPLELAEMGATLDLISGGRFILGVGLGYRQEEYDAFGVPQEGRLRRFIDNVRLVQRLWAGEIVSFESPYCTLKDARLTLRPLQQPHPPVWIAANADAAVKRAARLGDTWALPAHNNLPALKRQLGLYFDELKTLGKPVPDDLPLRRELYVAPQRSTAIAEVRPYLDTKYDAYRQWGQDAALPQDDRWDSEFAELAKDRFVIGDPASALEELQRYREEMPDVNQFIFRAQYPGMPQEMVLRSIRLVAEQVRPHLR